VIQVDRVAAGARFEIRHRHGRAGGRKEAIEVERVAARAECDRRRSRAEQLDLVVAVSGVDRDGRRRVDADPNIVIVRVAAGDQLIGAAGAAERDRIRAVSAAQNVVARYVFGERIAVHAAQQSIVAGAAEHLIAARSAFDQIVPGSTVEIVVALAAEQMVGAAESV
jgi:hypothetical protein